MVTTLLLHAQSLMADVAYKPFKDRSVEIACNKGSGLFNLPRWYEYLQTPLDSSGKPLCTPALTGINDIWLVGLAVIEIMLQIAVLVAIGFVVYGGAKYITARGYNGQGGPDKLNSAKLTVYDALTGLIFAVVAAAAVSYIGGRFAQ
jgi:hypothetical protein